MELKTALEAFQPFTYLHTRDEIAALLTIEHLFKNRTSDLIQVLDGQHTLGGGVGIPLPVYLASLGRPFEIPAEPTDTEKLGRACRYEPYNLLEKVETTLHCDLLRNPSGPYDCWLVLGADGILPDLERTITHYLNASFWGQPAATATVFIGSAGTPKHISPLVPSAELSEDKDTKRSILEKYLNDFRVVPPESGLDTLVERVPYNLIPHLLRTAIRLEYAGKAAAMPFQLSTKSFYQAVSGIATLRA